LTLSSSVIECCKPLNISLDTCVIQAIIIDDDSTFIAACCEAARVQSTQNANGFNVSHYECDGRREISQPFVGSVVWKFSYILLARFCVFVPHMHFTSRHDVDTEVFVRLSAIIRDRNLQVTDFQRFINIQKHPILESNSNDLKNFHQLSRQTAVDVFRLMSNRNRF
jgi:hypothetical protein